MASSTSVMVNQIISLVALAFAVGIYFFTVVEQWVPATLVFGPELEPGEYHAYTLLLRGAALLLLSMSATGWDPRVGVVFGCIPMLLHSMPFAHPLTHELGVFGVLTAGVLGLNAGVLGRTLSKTWAAGGNRDETTTIADNAASASLTRPYTIAATAAAILPASASKPPVSRNANQNVASNIKATTPAVNSNITSPPPSQSKQSSKIAASPATSSLAESPTVIRAREEAKEKQRQRVLERIEKLKKGG